MKAKVYTINSNTSELAIVATDKVYHVKREGIGLKLVDQPTATELASVNSFQYRCANTLTIVPSGSFFNKTATQQLTITTWRQTFRVGNTVTAGDTFNFELDGTLVTYEATTGQSATDVANALKTLIDATTFSTGVTCTVSTPTFMGELYVLLLIDTLGLPTTTSTFYPAGYFITKSGLWIVFGGDDYILEEVEANSYEFPAIPSIGLSYNYGDLIFAQFGIEFYLYEGSHPTEVTYIESLSLGSTDITNAPTGVVSLSNNEVSHDTSNDKLFFGNPFLSGSPEVVQILYE